MEVIRLSPSRIGEYQQCPQLYNYRNIQKLPEPVSLDAARGTLVHNVLEELLSLPVADRTLQTAQELAPKHWQLQKSSHADLAIAVSNDSEWLARANALLDSYFRLENPQAFQPTLMEAHLEVPVSETILFHGFVDRIDVAPTGEVRIVDYKTGKAPKFGYEDKALFQLRFYALLWQKLHGVVPRLLQLLYLGDEKTLKNVPTAGELSRTEQKAITIGEEIKISIEKDYWPTKTSKLCDWCSFKEICPAFSS